MMDFTVLYNVLDKYGWLGVFGVLLISMLFLIIKNQTSKTTKTLNNGFEKLADTMSQQNEKLLNNIQDTNKQLLDYVINGNKKEHEEKCDYRLEIIERINDTLHDMMNEYHSNRAAIIEFHNSKENLDGLSFVWYDIHYEKFQKGTQDIMMQVQNQPSSILIPIIKRLRTSDYVLLSKNDIEDLFDESPVFYNQLQKISGLEYIMFAGIYNDSNRLIGLTTLEWHKQIDIKQINDNLDHFRCKVTEITSLIKFIRKTDE